VTKETLQYPLATPLKLLSQNLRDCLDIIQKSQRTPMSGNHHQEVNYLFTCSVVDAASSLSAIGSLYWIISLCWYNISYATWTLGRCNKMTPREQYLTQARRVVGYLKHFPKGVSMHDTAYTEHIIFHTEERLNGERGGGEFNPWASEEISMGPPEKKGKLGRMRALHMTSSLGDLSPVFAFSYIILL
jgi:hypothetical protein